jgi:hypothetical protein
MNTHHLLIIYYNPAVLSGLLLKNAVQQQYPHSVAQPEDDYP